MNDSILNSVKKIIGLNDSNTDFDIDIIMHINTKLMALKQEGVITVNNYQVTDATKKWSDILDNTQTDLYAIKTWLALSVRKIFDPPTSNQVALALDDAIKECEFRMYVTKNYVGEI